MSVYSDMTRTASRRALVGFGVFVFSLTAATAHAADPLAETVALTRTAILDANSILTVAWRVLSVAVILNMVAAGLGILTAGITQLPDSRWKKAVAITSGIVVGFVTIVSNTLFGLDVRATTKKISTLNDAVSVSERALRGLQQTPPADEVARLAKLVQDSYYSPVTKGTQDLQDAINGSLAYLWYGIRTSPQTASRRLFGSPFAVLEAAQQKAMPPQQAGSGPNLEFTGEGTGTTLADAASRAEADAYRKVAGYLRSELTKRTTAPIPESWLKKYARNVASIDRSRVESSQGNKVSTTVRVNRLAAIVGSAEVPSAAIVRVHEYRIASTRLDTAQLCVYVGDVHELGERTRVVIFRPKGDAACPADTKDISEKEIDRRAAGAQLLLDRAMTLDDEVPLRDGPYTAAVTALKYQHRAPDQEMTIEIVRTSKPGS